MNAGRLWWTLGWIDLQNMRRDALLASLPAGTLALALVLRWVPELDPLVEAAWGLSLAPFYPLFVSTYFLVAPGIAGLIVGFLLLDERDDGVLDALMVTPVPPAAYLNYRLMSPLLLGLVVTLAGYPLIGLVAVPLPALLAVTLLASLLAPMMALFLAAFAETKVSGFALIKGANIVLVLPFLDFVYDGWWTGPLYLIPNYWSLKAFWLAADGAPYAVHVGVGLLASAGILAWLVPRFHRRQHGLV